MKIFPPEPEITASTGFASDIDIFQREKFGSSLTKLVTSIDNAVVALDAPWGQGKTTFIRMWEGQLQAQGVPSIRFDAFFNDYQSDAFSALAGEIIAYSQRLKNLDHVVTEDFQEKALEVSKILAKGAVKIAVRAATLGVVDANLIGQIGDIGNDAVAVTDELLRSRLEDQNQNRIAFDKFREALSDIASRMQVAQPDEGASPPPLIFIIDELDRCRPNYALEILETIKHFFSVGGVNFVLATNLAQLEASVRFAYGDGVDAANYLQKFYNIRVRLPERSGERHDQETAHIYCLWLAKQLVADDQEGQYWSSLANTLALLAGHHALSLRSIERVFSYAALVVGFTKKNFLRDPDLIGPLCLMKVVLPSLFEKARNGTITFGELPQILPDPAHYRGHRDEVSIEHLWHLWRYCTDPSIDPKSDEWQGYGRYAWDFRIRDRKKIVSVASEVVDMFLIAD